MTPGAARHVFVSFASQDVQLAHRVVEQLERAGLRCWISDRDIEPAASYPAAITAAVKESGAFLLLLTPAANQSPHVLREIELAGTATIRRRIVAVERPGSRATSPFLETMWGLLDRIPELIPRALSIAAADQGVRDPDPPA